MVVVAPFFLIHDVQTALKISNLLGGLLLFTVSYLRALDRNLLPRIANGVGTSLIGIIIAGITVLLGG